MMTPDGSKRLILSHFYSFYFFFMSRSEAYKPGLAWFSAFALVFTVLPLAAGGFTTSIQAGMAFLDWPLSNGSLNPEGWTEDPHQLAEHSHRLLAKVLGILSIILVVWTQLVEARRWVRNLAWGIFGMVVFQGLLGGLRVLLDRLNIQTDHNMIAQTFAILHATCAQIVVMLLVSIALATSRFWINRQAGLTKPVDSLTRNLGLASVAALLLQVVLGAIMRHNHAGLAIPTFPLTPEGGLIPVYWSFPVTINFLHRAWAIGVTVILLAFITRVWGSTQLRNAFGWLAVVTTLVLTLQIYLGALTIWTVKNAHAATLHALVGAGLIATTYAMTFLCYRLRPEQEEASLRITPKTAQTTPSLS